MRYSTLRNLLLQFIIISSLFFTSSCQKSIGPLTGIPVDSIQTTHLKPAMHPLPLPDIIPNIILILGDDVGYEIPEVDGGQSYSTPNLDMMAQNGMRFTQCRATPLCSPSRFELLTGKYNSRNYFAWGIMDLTQKTIANILKDAGYKTCVTGKWQLDGGDNSIHTFGFDDYSVWQPYEIMGTSNPTWSRYKDPAVYTDSAFWPKSERAGKYSEDVFMDHFF